jgi:hypothetical protein
MAYKVMVNHEGQYSIRLGDREPPLGRGSLENRPEVRVSGLHQESLDGHADA